MLDRLLATLLAVLATSGGIQAQGLQATGGRELLATVVDMRGRPLVDFGVDDFVVTEGGQDREILDVHVADYPVAVVLDDTSDSSAWPTIRATAARFITRIGERPVAVGVLSDTTLVASLDDDRQTVLQRLEALPARPLAERALLEAVERAGRLLRATESPFSAVVVIASGRVDASALVRADLLTGIVESGATVHVIETRQLSGQDQDTPEKGDLLRVIADQTHGQYTTIFSPLSYSIALDRLADRLSAELMVQYLVPPGVAPGDIRVGVRRPGARVLGLGVSR